MLQTWYASEHMYMQYNSATCLVHINTCIHLVQHCYTPGTQHTCTHVVQHCYTPIHINTHTPVVYLRYKPGTHHHTCTHSTALSHTWYTATQMDVAQLCYTPWHTSTHLHFTPSAELHLMRSTGSVSETFSQPNHLALALTCLESSAPLLSCCRCQLPLDLSTHPQLPVNITTTIIVNDTNHQLFSSFVLLTNQLFFFSFFCVIDSSTFLPFYLALM